MIYIIEATVSQNLTDVQKNPKTLLFSFFASWNFAAFSSSKRKLESLEFYDSAHCFYTRRIYYLV